VHYTLYDVYVKSRSRHARIIWIDANTMRAYVHAVSDDGKANVAVKELVASYFGVPKSAISIVRGRTHSKRVVHVASNV